MRDVALFPTRPWFNEKILLGLSGREYVHSLATWGNLIAAGILAVGIPVIVYRFVAGLGATTNLTQTNPWGLWIGFDMLGGIALAAGGYTLASSVYLFGLKDYHAAVRPAVLTGFLGYLFAVFGLLCDLGRPWNLPVPMVYSFGTTSVMFEVGWCVALYTCVLALEFAPSVLDWLGLRQFRDQLLKLTIGLTVVAVMLSTLHQSSLGALFLMAPTRLHPLWYSPFIPIFFFVSSIVAGLCMVVVESGLSRRAFSSQVDEHHAADLDRITVGLGRAAAVVLFCYFFLKLQGIADAGAWHLLATGWGGWFLVELLGFVLLPSFVLAHGARTANPTLVRWAAAWTVLGVVLNRLNVSIVAFNWNAAERYVPSAMEVMASITLVTMGILAFRWIVNRMPVLRPMSDEATDH